VRQGAGTGGTGKDPWILRKDERPLPSRDDGSFAAINSRLGKRETGERKRVRERENNYIGRIARARD